MRRRVSIWFGVLVFIVAIIAGAVWLIPPKPHAGPWRLADGSELSLAGVTYGKKHKMRYGDRMVDYLYPILPDRLREKFNCKVATIDTPNSDGIVVWFWDKLQSPPFGSRRQAYVIRVADSSGFESEQFFSNFKTSNLLPNSTTLWRSTNDLEGWEINNFPRRSKQFNIRVYQTDNSTNPIGEFTIWNRTRRRYPVWKAQPLPVTARTNSLEIELAAFKTEKRETDAEIYVTERQRPAGEWTVRSVTASSATGESREAWVGNLSSSRSAIVFAGTFWQEEPAWKLDVELWRKANFPMEELWTVKGVPVPAEGKTQELNLTTNIYGSEIGIYAITGSKNTRNFGDVPVPAMTLHVRSPIPEMDAHLVLVEVKDENGKKIEFFDAASTPGTGGRGATIRELDEDYELKDAGKARSLEVTLAYTKSVFVEFLAKPAIQAPAPNSNLQRSSKTRAPIRSAGLPAASTADNRW